jgi:nicotinamide-nucleotide adenylyltransferase
MKRTGLVCRWKPVHLGHEALLVTLCERSSHVLVGIGSANRRNARNPFTATESARMVELVLAPRFSNYELVLVPDLDDGPRWSALVRTLMGELDLFVTENSWVRELMTPLYTVRHPGTIVPQERHAPIDGTLVRRRMARGEEWRSLVPSRVATYLEEEGLVLRFQREFGLETLARELVP